MVQGLVQTFGFIQTHNTTKLGVVFSFYETGSREMQENAQKITDAGYGCNTSSIEEAWKSKEMEFFREIHKNGEFWKHPVCKKCVLSTSHFDVQNNL